MILLRERKFGLPSIPAYGQDIGTAQDGKYQIKNDGSIMTAAGRVGLTTAAGIGLGAAYQGSRAVIEGYRGKKELSKFLDATKDPEVRKNISNSIKKGISGVVSRSNPQAATAIGPAVSQAVSMAESGLKTGYDTYRGLKKSPISRANLVINYWNKLSRAPRIALLNAETGAKAVVNQAMPHLTGEAEKKAVGYIPGIVQRAANSGLHLKNAKLLGRASAGLASISALTYVNGRALQPNKKVKKDGNS